MTNPLLAPWDTPFGLPPFDDISDDHFAPAFEAALEEGMTRRNALGAVAALRGLGRIRQALTMLEAGIGRWPESALMRNNYGVLLHEQGRLVEAERELRVAARILDRGASDAGHVAAALRAEVGRNLSLIAVALEMEEERTGRPLRPPLAEPDGGLKLLKDEGAR